MLKSLLAQIIWKLSEKEGISWLTPFIDRSQMWKIPSFHHNFFNFWVRMLYNISKWRSWKVDCKTPQIFMFLMLRSQVTMIHRYMYKISNLWNTTTFKPPKKCILQKSFEPDFFPYSFAALSVPFLSNMAHNWRVV